MAYSLFEPIEFGMIEETHIFRVLEYLTDYKGETVVELGSGLTSFGTKSLYVRKLIVID